MSAEYIRDEKNRIFLKYADPETTGKELNVEEGTYGICADAFADVPWLERVYLPASVSCLPDGCLSNGGGWASEDKGIRDVRIDPENEIFRAEGCCILEKRNDNSSRLVKILDGEETVSVPQNVTMIACGAFLDRRIVSVRLESENTVIRFPTSHAYNLNMLLNEFGKNGKLYDFSLYDRFLLQNHFNTERIEMICLRIQSSFEMSETNRQKLLDHLDNCSEDLMEAVLKNGETKHLEMLADAGYITEKNIDAMIEEINRSDRKDLMFWMMDYKNEHFDVKDELYI